MVVNIVPSLRAILDGLVVTNTGHSITFNYVDWGHHWNTTGDLITARNVLNLHDVADIGGGAQTNEQSVDVHVYFQDADDLADEDMEDFKQAIQVAIIDAIRTNEKSIGTAYYTQVTNVNDESELLEQDATTVLSNHLVITIEAHGAEVYG